MKPQSWLHSWYVDLPFFNLIPILSALFFYVYFFHVQFVSEHVVLGLLVWLGVIDWAHFASIWPRIFSNPVETRSSRLIFFGSYILIVLSYIILCYFIKDRFFLIVGIAYLAVFHVLKQQFGFIRIYARTDAPKTPFESSNEQALIYLSMTTPVLYWHYHNTDPDGIWFREFIKHKNFYWAFIASLCCYFFSFITYLYFEFKRSVANNYFNLAKNLSLLSTMIGWGIVSFFPKNALVLVFAVHLNHNISYIAIVWLMGRRDTKLFHGEISKWSFFSIQGAAFYAILVMVAGQVIYVAFQELNFDRNDNYVLLGTALNWIPKGEGWIEHLGRGIFYGTQVHHFIIDGFLWKKEKDLSFMIRTNQIAPKVKLVGK